ncbi:large ribosomal subunit protein bL28m isoform X1 [Halyomorpha halys]|uniref:large ribosomal subunit protein bL28m isoform X1 n=1 Tax=Halyomorpha halys TaxID=286706 RepID=UPI0006D4CEE4|nr:39S ribosomal protein L28, mitochondrial isoform X1 [Halyomorpha halys]
MTSRVSLAVRLYKFPKPNILETHGEHLPDSYKKFYKEWKFSQPQPVHYIPPPAKWYRNPDTGEVTPLQNNPIPLKFPPESHQGIWGGEAVIKGFQKRQRLKQRVPHFWVPHLIQSVVYSEILNKRMSVTVTLRTLDLIVENYGFDHYILKTKACDLQSSLALKLKQKMLYSLLKMDMYPDDPIKKNEVYNKYKHYLEEYTEEDIEWYGLTLSEALMKYQEKIDKEPIVPFKIKLRKEYLAHLLEEKSNPEQELPSDKKERSWMTKWNPFSKN